MNDRKLWKSTGNTCLGNHSGASITTESNCLFIGHNAGRDATGQDGMVIIGDDILTLSDGSMSEFGGTVFGKMIDADGLRDGDPQAWKSVIQLTTRYIHEWVQSGPG